MTGSVVPPTTISDEAEQRTLYEFDWNWRGESGTQIGWRNGRHWVGCFGDGLWSTEFVTAFRPYLPVIEAGLRAKISDEILTAASKTPCVAANGRTYWMHSLETRLAARVARGTQEATND